MLKCHAQNLAFIIVRVAEHCQKWNFTVGMSHLFRLDECCLWVGLFLGKEVLLDFKGCDNVGSLSFWAISKSKDFHIQRRNVMQKQNLALYTVVHFL